MVNLFDLEPEATLFLERTPPVDHHAEMRQWAAQELPARARPLPIQTLLTGWGEKMPGLCKSGQSQIEEAGKSWA